MIKQVCTFYEDTYNMKSYKEFNEGKLIVHTEYDVNNNQTYFESNYGGEPRYWMKRKFAKGCKDNTGDIIFYENSNGDFKYIRDKGKRRISIKNKFGVETKFDGKQIPIEWIEITCLSVDGMSLFELNASRVVGTPHFYANHYKENGKYFKLEYVRVRFEEIYYHDASDKRQIIHVDEAQRITEYKDLMEEFNIIMCSERYRPNSREFRKFIPIY